MDNEFVGKQLVVSRADFLGVLKTISPKRTTEAILSTKIVIATLGNDVIFSTAIINRIRKERTHMGLEVVAGGCVEVPQRC